MKRLALNVCWLLVFLLATLALVSLVAGPFVAMAIWSGQLRYDFGFALTSKGPPAQSMEQMTVEEVSTPESITATYFPEPPPPPPAPEPTFADDLAGALARVEGHAADRHKLGEVFRQAAASLRRTFITTDLEVTKFLAYNAAHELGDRFAAWEPFLNFYAESLSELKRGGQLADNDMQALAAICAETATLLSQSGGTQ